MIYIVGVNHEVQMLRNGCSLTWDNRQLQSTVESAIESYDLHLLAEEMHPEILKKEKAQSILSQIAKDHGIEHRFVDPDTSERKAIGYRESGFIIKNHSLCPVVALAHEIEHQFPKREKFWLDRLRPSLHAGLLLVCGSGHVESFQDLLRQENIQSSVLTDQIGVDDWHQAIDAPSRTYIKQHPNEFNNPECFCHSERPITLG